jgi:hypothetical protein
VPVAVAIKSRLISMQDLALTTDPSGETFNATVLGLGTTALNKIPMVRLDHFTQAANQLAAIGLGVQPGQVYYDTGIAALRAVTSLNYLPLTGTKNGINLVFGLPSTQYSFIALVRNGKIMSQSEYTIVGSVVTFQTLTGYASLASATGVLARVSGDYFLQSMAGCTITVNSLSSLVLNTVNAGVCQIAQTAAFTNLQWTCPIAPVQGDEIYALYS